MLVACCATAQLLLIAHSMTAWFGRLAEHAAVTMHRAADCLLTNPLSQLDPAISDQRLLESFRALRVPRNLFKFLYRLLVDHCNTYTDQAPEYVVSSQTYESTLTVLLREQEAFDQGTGPG